ncbi:MAG TPA: nucleotidyl transferase AbiEii/AbiGii toxin family protein [Caldilineaceae bacterium]|nr:nucleotidyl transferase AbiEii/AbiGii toxin family protein [Caldilineaceae bacterium]
MKAREIWRRVTEDRVDLLDQLLQLLHEHHIRYCVIDGQAVNAYAAPLISLDLDLVIALEQVETAAALLAERFTVRRFPHSINVSAPGSNLRVQIQTDKRYFPFVERAAPKDGLGVTLPVARVEDVLQGKVWAFLDDERGNTKRQKDLADIARLLEAYPHLRSQVPDEVLRRLL